MNSGNELLSFWELCSWLKISRTKVYGMLEDGLPFVMVGKQRRFIPSDVIEWLKKAGEK